MSTRRAELFRSAGLRAKLAKMSMVLPRYFEMLLNFNESSIVFLFIKFQHFHFRSRKRSETQGMRHAPARIECRD